MSFIRLNFILLFVLLNTLPAHAARILMRDGRLLLGEFNKVAKIDAIVGPPGEVAQTKSIMLIDDGLRRIFVSQKNVVDVSPDDIALTIFRFQQRFAGSEGTQKYESLGDVRPVGPFAEFDPYGRRVVALMGPNGPEYEIQSITEINSRYVRARGLNRIWDARYSTHAIPQSVLSPILRQNIDPNVFEDRLKIFNFYLLAEYYEAAQGELESIQTDFAADPKIKDNSIIIQAIRRVQQLSADRLEKELQMRSDAGQHQQVVRLLKTFPSEYTSALTLQRIGRLREHYESLERKRDDLFDRLSELAEKITDEKHKQVVAELLKEIRAELNLNTMERFEAFWFNEQDPSLSDEERLSIVLSAWLIGKETEVRRMVVAVSLAETRDLVREYLRQKEFDSATAIYDAIRKQEAGTPELIAALLKRMKPPMETDWERLADPEQPGYFNLERPGIAETPYETVRYTIQLPPEYDPNRSYPVIVALHNSSGPDGMIRWWCGLWKDGYRFGQATRHGYIVIAPHWALPGQKSYDSSPLAHAAVLYSLSDAVSRFNIDTDRVFLTGHGMGGSAAWDIAAAHPDIWAGLILFGAAASPPVRVYDDNLQHVPLYFVCGELESASGRNLTIHNGPTLNYYLKKGFNATVVQYLGRGPEMYGEEVQEIFRWMKNLKRTFPTLFTVKSTRAQSKFYYFWGIEYPELPNELNWPQDNKGNRDVLETNYEYVEKSNKVKIKTKSRFSGFNPEIFLTPDMVQFNQRITVEFNGKAIQPRSGFVEPDLRLILEDARTRKDRQHPFWVRLNPAVRE
ncbi:MAG: hypothetical protein FWC43_06380 [Planctomycetaceae bacterium]|nr:hypothetical protein [Planctomycetaceae bacterium]